MYRSKKEDQIKDIESFTYTTHTPTHPHTHTVNLRGCTSPSLSLQWCSGNVTASAIARVYHFGLETVVCKGRARAKTIFRGQVGGLYPSWYENK